MNAEFQIKSRRYAARVFSESYEYRITRSLYVRDTPWENPQRPSRILPFHPSGLTMGIVCFRPSIFSPYFRDSSRLPSRAPFACPPASRTIIHVGRSQYMNLFAWLRGCWTLTEMSMGNCCTCPTSIRSLSYWKVRIGLETFR